MVGRVFFGGWLGLGVGQFEQAFAAYLELFVLMGLWGVISPLTYSAIEQSLLWKKSWNAQKILRALPQSMVDLANSQSLILVDAPPRNRAGLYIQRLWGYERSNHSWMTEYVDEKKRTLSQPLPGTESGVPHGMEYQYGKLGVIRRTVRYGAWKPVSYICGDTPRKMPLPLLHRMTVEVNPSKFS